jgi:hypothetical protein
MQLPDIIKKAKTWQKMKKENKKRPGEGMEQKLKPVEGQKVKMKRRTGCNGILRNKSNCRDTLQKKLSIIKRDNGQNTFRQMKQIENGAVIKQRASRIRTYYKKFLM